jgi:TonB-linked SusC/RagA family outer membrane protein
MKKTNPSCFRIGKACRKNPRQLLAGILMLATCFSLHAQVSFAGNRKFTQSSASQRQEERVTIKAKNEKLSAILAKIEKQIQYVFVYSDDDVNAAQRISIEVKNEPLPSILDALSKMANISAEIINDKIILRGRSGGRIDTQDINAVQTYTQGIGLIPQRNSQPDKIITGKITDENGLPISSVSVTVKGTSIGTTTNSNGNYSLLLPENLLDPVLAFSIVGYENLEVAVDGRQTVSISLKKMETVLEDVVVVGYGTQRRSSVTGAVDGISSKAIEGRPVANVLQAMQGASPNLIIQQRNFEPGQGVNLNIRGLGTLGDNTPLVVIDGIPGGDVNLLNPNDIENISILKDAGSAAIYGSRSANGVILITTRKGKKNEKATVRYNGIYGIQSPRVTYQPVHAWENAYYKNESLANSGLQPSFTPDQIRTFAERGDGDWRLNNILRDAPQQTHNLSISGGSDHSTYLISLGYLNQENNFIGDGLGYKRYNVRLNQMTEIGKLKLNAILSYAKVLGRDHSSTASTLIVDAGRVPLYYSFTDSLGNYLTNPVSSEFNPKGILEKGGYRRNDNDEVFGNINAEFAVTNDFKIRAVFGGTIRANHGFGRRLQINFQPGGVYGNDREVYDDNYKSIFTNLQLLAEYNKSFGEHSFNALVGSANESFKSEQNRITKTLTDPNLGTPTTGTIISESASYNANQGTTETSINSVFGRAGYNFSGKYFAEFNFRYDGSSKFAKDSRWGFFPSVAAAWRVSDEAFLNGTKGWLNDLKIRTSYGVLGNQNVNAYQYQTTYFNFPNAYGFNGSPVGGAGFLLGNPNLTWEKAATLNIGGDAILFNRKLEISYDYFDKTTSDILYTRRDVPQIFGAGFPDYNVAKVKNRGWEVKATYHLRGKIFSHSFSLNVADNLNELLALTSGATEQVERKEEFELARRIGYPITVYQGYRRNGYIQTLDDITNAPKFAGSTLVPGDIQFVDRNKDGIIDDNDKFILGNPFPRYTFGFTYTANFKGFDVQVFIQGVGKRDAMLRGELVEPFHFGYGGTMYTHQTDYWTPTNPDAKYPRLAEAGSPSNTNNYRTGSDIYLFDAAYARLKNVQIGYTIPQAITMKAGIRRARFYLTGQNLITLSKLDFFDPELTEFDNNTGFNTGANSARAYPLPVFYGFGLDVTF